MTVKENQPTLFADLALLFKRPPGPGQDLRTVVQVSKGHGRLETRTLAASTDAKGFVDWPKLEQGLCLERRVVDLATGLISTEHVYGLTNLRADQLDLAKLLQRWRDHWTIENRLHWVKDVIFKEDACRVHVGQAPFVLAALRNALVSCFHALGFDSISQAKRHFALNLDEALAFVCGSLE